MGVGSITLMNVCFTPFSVLYNSFTMSHMAMSFLCPRFKNGKFVGYDFCARCARLEKGSKRQVKAIYPRQVPVFCWDCAGMGIILWCPYCGDNHTAIGCNRGIQLLRIKLKRVLGQGSKKNYTVTGEQRKW